MPTYVYQCSSCEHTFDVLCRIADRKEVISCESCGQETAQCIPQAPMVLKASYPDGTRRFQEFKEASKLNKEAANSRPETRKEIAKEIRKLGVKISKD